MPRRMIDSVLKTIEACRSVQVDGWIPKPVFIKFMRLYCGGRTETIKRYNEFIRSFNLTLDEEQRDNVVWIKINWDKVDELML